MSEPAPSPPRLDPGNPQKQAPGSATGSATQTATVILTASKPDADVLVYALDAFHDSELPDRQGSTRSESDLETVAIAGDIIDLDLTVAVVLQRTLPIQQSGGSDGVTGTARLIATALSAKLFLHQSGTLPGGVDLVERLRSALTAAIDTAGDAAAGSRLFVQTLDESAGKLLVALANGRHADSAEFAQWLKAANARLLFIVRLAESQSRLQALDAFPRAFWLSWRSWMDDFAQMSGRSIREWAEIVAAAADRPLASRREPDLERERIFFILLRNAIDRRTGDIVKRSDLVEAVRSACSAMLANEDPDGVARACVDRIFYYGDLPAQAAAAGQKSSIPVGYGAIDHTVLVLWALLEAPGWDDLLLLARELLPDGEVPERLLPHDLRQIWLRAREDDQRLGRETRPPPTWIALFDHVRGRVLHNLGLTLPDFVRVGDRGRYFDRAHVHKRLKTEQPDQLRSLIERIRARELFRTLPRKAIRVLARLVANIRREAPNLLSTAEFVRLVSGISEADNRLMIPFEVVTEHLDKWIALHTDLYALHPISRIGEAEVFVAAMRALSNTDLVDNADDFQARQDQLLFGAVSALRDVVAVSCETEEDPTGFVDAVLSEILKRCDRRTGWVLISFLILNGPTPSDAVLGQLTLKQFEASSNDEQAEHLAAFEQHLGLTMNSAAAMPRSGTASVDRWADAVASAASDRLKAEAAEIVASYMDDSISRYDIVWHRPRRLEAATPVPVLAPVFLGPGTGRADRQGPDLIERLFAQSAEAHLGNIEALNYPADPEFFLSTQRRLTDLLSETFWVLGDELDPDETDTIDNRTPRLSHAIWQGISRVYGLKPLTGARSAAELILSRRHAPLGSPDRWPMLLLDLYAPTILLHWRFRLYGHQPISPTNAPGYIACIDRLRAAAQARLPDVHRALQALEAAEANLFDLFRTNRAIKTAERHLARRQRIAGLVDAFAAKSLPVPIEIPRSS
ncbi:MAG: hypothetical protein P4L98_23535 [Ancalomicrobiaceae bacterium]|nr:hypothetical protein [Ancalomicrobiaceae bacterium]